MFISPLGNIPPASPINTVTPFTYRDNDTYLTILERLRTNLNLTIDYINDVSVNNTTEINAAIAALTAELNATLDSSLTNINAALSTLDAMQTTLGDLEASVATNTTNVADATASLNALLASINSDLNGKVAKGTLVVNVKDFGAAGDGVADDTTEIQAAINSAVATVRRLYFPPGTYLVSGNADILTLTSGIEIFGAGATIKVKDANGSWTAVINGGTNDLSGLKIHGLIFDGNATNNQPVAGDIVAGNFTTAKRRVAIRADFGSGITIERNRFHDFVGTWVIVSSNSARNVRILRNIFTQIGKVTNTALTHDHSSVYIDAVDFEVAGNIFTSNATTATLTATISTGAVSAIDTHGSAQKIHHNVVIAYIHGLQLSTSPTVDNVGISAHHNQFINCGHGIHLTPYTQGMRQVDIHNNYMEIDHLTWKDHPWKNGSCGVSMNSGDGGTIKNLNIRDNIIKWKEATLTGLSSLGLGSVSNGIQWIRRKADHSEIDSNISFERNVIDGAPDGGIHAQFANITNLKIADNTIRDANSSANNDNVYGLGILVDTYTSVAYVKIARNSVIDTQKVGVAPYGNAAHTIKAGYSLWAAAGFFADSADNNTMSVADGAVCKFVRENDKAIFNPPIIRTNADYMPEFAGKSATAMVADEAIWVPIELGVGTITQIGAEITTTVAGSSIEVGLYRDWHGKPGDKIYALGTIDSTLSSFRATPVGNFPVAAGRYWIAFVAHGGAPSVNMALGHNSLLRGNAFSGVSVGDLTGVKATGQATLPATAPAPTSYGKGPLFYAVGA